jgi:hypothetical protein
MADERSLRELGDRTAVSDVILAFARSLDLKDWEGCRCCFLDEIETDYSDLRGEPPSRTSASDFVAKRRAALEHLKTLHLSTPGHRRGRHRHLRLRRSDPPAPPRGW